MEQSLVLRLPDPFRLILTTLLKFARSEGDMILIYCTVLAESALVSSHIEMAGGLPIQIPNKHGLSVSEERTTTTSTLSPLESVWKLSTDRSKRRVFLKELQTLQPWLGDQLLPKLTIPD